jgi:transposase InsO family protein
VRREIVRLAALLSRPTCRAIAEILSRRFAQSRKMTVGRTFVNSVLRAKRYEIEVEKRRIKNAKPRQLPRNRVWGLDLTGKTDTGGRLHFVLGLLDHGTRANMSLVALVNKSSFALLGHLFLAIGRFGKPRAVRTDNEPIFTSRMFRFALALLGIRHQRTDPGCPWQNGRIERFFGTLKERLDRLAVDSAEALNGALAEFRFFYNHVRPHQNLAGFTPAEAWAGVDPFRVRVKDERWFEAWDGLLTGYYLRR